MLLLVRGFALWGARCWLKDLPLGVLDTRHWIASQQSWFREQAWHYGFQDLRARLDNRASKFAVREDEKGAMKVCPRHRKSLTTDWLGRQRTICCYPNHKGERKGNAQTRRANAQLSQEIFDLFNTVVPIGSGEFYVRILTLRRLNW